MCIQTPIGGWKTQSNGGRHGAIIELDRCQYGTAADHLQIEDYAVGRHLLGLKFILDSL